MDAMAIVMECPVQAQSRKRYVLTNGLDVYELRRMDELELMVAQQNALLHGRVELWWDGAD